MVYSFNPLIKIVLIFLLNLTNAQVRPDYRKFPDGYDIHYRFTTTLRSTTVPPNPDSFYFGFFPIWSALLLGLTGFCFFVSILGLLCWLIGCINPRRQLIKEANILKKQQEYEKHYPQGLDTSEQLYDDISMRMLDTMDKNASSLFNETRLVSEYELDLNKNAKKKKFMKDHL